MDLTDISKRLLFFCPEMDSMLLNGMLKTLNQAQMINIVNSDVGIKRFINIYNLCFQYTENGIMTPSQYAYFVCITSGDGSCFVEPLKRNVNSYLISYGNNKLFRQYQRFRRLRSRIKTKNYIGTPLPVDVEHINKLARLILNCQNNQEWINKSIKERNEKRDMAYGDGKYIVLMPNNVNEIVEEAFSMNINLINVLGSYVNGSEEIFFLRQSSDINEPYVSFTILCDEIVFIFGPDGRLPRISVLRFLEKYSRVMGIKYDPSFIIDCEFEDFYERYTDNQLKKLKEYALQYRKEHNASQSYEDGDS